MIPKFTESFFLPVVFTILLLAVTALTGLVAIQDLVKASVLLAVVMAGVLGVQYFAARHAASVASEGLFNVLASVALSDARAEAKSGLLTEQEVLALEGAASRVWVYAYDLAWEGDSSPFTKVVSQNLARGVTYRYLIPDAREVQLRARQMVTKVGSQGGRLTVRATPRERLITQFGLVIYNPTLLQSAPSEEGATVAVFFPHLSFAAGDPNRSVPFLAVRGSAVARLQEAFVQYWEEASPLPSGN